MRAGTSAAFLTFFLSAHLCARSKTGLREVCKLLQIFYFQHFADLLITARVFTR